MGKKKKKSSSSGGGGGFVVVIVLFVVIFFLMTRETKPIEYVSSLGELSAPVQTTTTGSTTVKAKGEDVTLEHVANYTITGVVIRAQGNYDKSIQDQLAPMDLGLAWGKVAENKDKINFKMTSQGFLDYTSDKATIKEIGGDNVIISQYSNNHLIPSTSDIEKNFLLLREGDIIKIEGYLVNANTSSEQVFKTSTTRDDSGNGGAETIYVNKMVWLEEKTY